MADIIKCLCWWRGKMWSFESSGDSQDVAQYVDRKFAQGQLFPQAAAGLYEILLRYMEHEVEDISFRISDSDRTFAIPDLVSRTTMIRFKKRKFGQRCVAVWARQKPALLGQLSSLPGSSRGAAETFALPSFR